MQSSEVIIRLTNSFPQKVGDIQRVIGLMPAKYIIPIIDVLDLDANPRNSRMGAVTKAIQESIRSDELDSAHKLFPFKSKGILLASSRYETLDRHRIRLAFQPHDAVEGILDGGHNTLAIGNYILENALLAVGAKRPKQSEITIWERFKETWADYRPKIDEYLSIIRSEKEDSDNEENGRPSLKERGISTLDFLIPVELLLPAEPNDELCVENFRTSLLEICDARNNNAQLTAGTKGNQEGLFDAFKNLFQEKNPLFAEKISWKTNDGKPIQSRTLIALSWIPLSLIANSVTEGKIDAPAMTSIYSGKEICQGKFLELMRDDRVSKAAGSARRELKNVQIVSALEVATDLPELFDAIYEAFPGCYNRIGNYGRIGAVKSLKNSRSEYHTPFLGKKVDNPVPDGFIYPLACGLRALMEVDGEGKVRWTKDPFEFITSDAFSNAVEQYSGVIPQSEYDPQKVGKGAFSYTAAENSMKLAALMWK